MPPKLLLDPAVADVKAAGAPASPAAASPTPAAPPAAPAPATKTESASAPAPAATPAAEPAKASPWMEPPKQEDKKEPEKAAPPAAPEKKEPEKFDLKVPEGASMDAAALAKFESSMKELGFDAKQAQKILERDLAAQKASHEETLAMLKTQDAAGEKALRAKWGTKFAERSETVKRAFDYADPTGAFRKKLADSFLANNEDLIGFVEKFGELMKEDRIAAGPNAVAAGKDNRPLHERTQSAFKSWLDKSNKKG